MPRVHDSYTDIAVYIYKSLADAKAGERTGGSAFVVGVQLEQNPEFWEAYVVTNAHVIRKAINPVIRLNRQDGGIECIETHGDEWQKHPHGDDVAVYPLHGDFRQIALNFLRLDQFITPQLIADEDIGIGDDTMMIGRFTSHEGTQRNTPAVRFGTIAMMPREAIVSKEGIAQESFLVEIRSLPGYSGSAVILNSPGIGPGSADMSMRRQGQRRLTEEERDSFKGHAKTEMLLDSLKVFVAPKGPYLLGIDWCHLHNKAPVRNREGEIEENGCFVQENTGMAGVIPAWKIADVINCEDFRKMRQMADEKLTKNKRESSVSLDSAEESPKTQITADGAEIPIPATDQFFDDLKKASRKKD